MGPTLNQTENERAGREAETTHINLNVLEQIKCKRGKQAK